MLYLGYLPEFNKETLDAYSETDIKLLEHNEENIYNSQKK